MTTVEARPHEKPPDHDCDTIFLLEICKRDLPNDVSDDTNGITIYHPWRNAESAGAAGR